MDITTLGIGIDSRQVDDGKKALDDFSLAATKAEKAAAGVGDGAKKGAGGVKDFEDSMASASMKGTLAASAIEKGVQLAIDAVKQLYALMAEAGEYADLADMTGASAVNIAKLQTAADIAGASIQGMSGYMNQMTRVLKSTDEEGDKAARALSRIGISFEDFQKLDPAERMAALGQAMAGYADGAQKTEIAQALFGRGAGEVLKVLKVLGDETKFNTHLTKEMIDMTDAMSDANAEFTSQSRQLIQAVSTGVIPGMEALKGVVGETALEILGLSDKSDVLGANQGVKDFVIGAGHFITTIILPFELLGRLIEGAISAVKALAEGASAALRLDWSGVVSAAEGHLDRLKELSERKFITEKYQDKIDAQNAAAVRAMADAGEKQLEIVADISEKELAARKKADDERKKAAKKAADDALKEAEKQAEDFDKIVGGGTAKASGYNDNFINEMKIINAESKKRNLNEQQYRTIVDALIQQQPFYINGLKEQAKASEDYIDAETKAYEAAEKDRAAVLKSSNEAAIAAETELANRGKLKSEIAATTLARLEDLRVVHQADPVMREFYETQIANQKRVIAAMKGIELVDAAKKAADETTKVFEKAWEQVGQSLTDQLMEGSLKAADLMKNMFKTMILRPTIMGTMQGVGASFMGGAVSGGAAGGGGMGGIGGMAGSAAGSALFGGVGSAAASGFSGAMAAGLPVVNSIGVGAGMGLAAIPVAGWVALGAIAIYALYKKYGKSGGPKVEGSAGLVSDSLIGRYGNEMDSQTSNVVKDLNANYKRMATLLGSANTSVEFGVGVSTDPRGDAATMIQLINSLGSGYVDKGVGRSEEDLAAALAKGSAFVMVDALRNSGLDAQILGYFDEITVGMTNEAKLAAFDQVIAVAQYWKQLKTFGGVLTQFSNISLHAAVRLAELSGGIEALGTNIATYAANFLKPEEQASLKYQQIAAQLNVVGSGWTGWSEAILRTYNRDSFRRMVEGLNLETEGDRMRYAALMAVSGAFAELNPLIEEVAAKTETAAEKYQRLSDVFDTATDNLTDAYNRQKDALTSTRDAMRSATESFLDFNRSLRVDETLSTLDPSQRMGELYTQYAGASRKAAAGGYQSEDVSSMQEAARALLQGGREYYGSGEGYDALFNKVTTEMELAAGSTQYLGDVADQQLLALNRQVDHLIVINETLMSVDTAIRLFLEARHDLYTLGYPHAEGLSRVPYNNYPALLHQDEMVLPQNESAFIRSLPDFSGELRALRQEVASLRKENRQDAGNTIGATFTAAQQAAQVQSEATIRAARQRTYQSRSRPVLA